MKSGNQTAILAGLFAGVAWGMFWLPLRGLEASGLDAPWAMVVFTVVPALFCLPFIWGLRADYRHGWRILMGGGMAGLAYALYAAALLYTDVVRAVLLFYLTPVWGFLLGWLMLGDRMTWYRWAAIVLGVVGMAVVFGREAGLPLPRNAGDWFGLIAGMAWALACTLILTEKRVRVATQVVTFLVASGVVTLIVAVWASWQGLARVPQTGELGPVLLWFLPVVLVLILPGGYATIYAPSKLNPGLVGLLFMTEIVVAAVTAAIWAGEPFGLREGLGVALILSAGLLEPAVMMWRVKPVT